MVEGRKKKKRHVVVIGGGAAGMFAAVVCARQAGDRVDIRVLEGGRNPLAKVRISGGGRCNLSHDCEEPQELIKNYPRGGRSLLRPFHQFGPADIRRWFHEEGVPTKVESDGRVFPVSDDSASIVDALSFAAEQAGVVLHTQARVHHLLAEDEGFRVETKDEAFYADAVLIATGSAPKMWSILDTLGLQREAAIPSLFSFNTKDNRLAGLSGLSVPNALLRVEKTKLKNDGPLLITHWGLSGPAVLKLSSWGARELASLAYKFELSVNWLGIAVSSVEVAIDGARHHFGKRKLHRHCPVELPARLWQSLARFSKIPEDMRWGELNKGMRRSLVAALTDSRFQITAKSTNKDEFVTAGGIKLKEMNLKRFESKRYPGLFLAGEVLNIDAVTGGFNFQAAWTGGYLAGVAMAAL